MNFSIDRSAELLERTPAVLRSLLQGLPDEWTTVNEGPDTWSAFDVLGHLVHAERTAWIGRAEVILSDGDNSFAPLDRFAQLEENKGKTLNQLLDAFAALRAANIDALHRLPSDEASLQRTGIHPQLGTVTLAQLLATWTTHDLDHISQIVRVLARQYGDAVGPWKSNLRILRS